MQASLQNLLDLPPTLHTPLLQPLSHATRSGRPVLHPGALSLWRAVMAQWCPLAEASCTPGMATLKSNGIQRCLTPG